MHSSVKIPSEIVPQTAFSIARKSFNMKREFVLPVPLLYSYERLFFCSRTLLKHELSPLHQRLGLYTNPNKKNRFFRSLFQCNTFLSKFSLTRSQAAIAKDPGDGRQSKSSDLYQLHMQWNKKLPKNYPLRFCSYIHTYPRLRRRTDWLKRLMDGKLTHFYPFTCLLHPA